MMLKTLQQASHYLYGHNRVHIDVLDVTINPNVLKTSISDTEITFVLNNKNREFDKLTKAEQIFINKIVNKVN